MRLSSLALSTGLMAAGPGCLAGEAIPQTCGDLYVSSSMDTGDTGVDPNDVLWLDEDGDGCVDSADSCLSVDKMRFDTDDQIQRALGDGYEWYPEGDDACVDAF